jgi:hypothetical protein
LDALAASVFERDSFVLASVGRATKTIDAKDNVNAKNFFISLLLD